MGVPGSFCTTCKKAVVPPREICPYCGLSEGSMEPVDLSPEGVVLSYTVLEMPPSGFEPPVLLALVKLDHDATVLCLGDRELIGKIAIDTPVLVYSDESDRLHLALKK